MIQDKDQLTHTIHGGYTDFSPRHCHPLLADRSKQKTAS
jgi:hypothetical protein